MTKLSDDLHAAFNQIIIASLRNAQIITVADFVRADGNHLYAIIQKGIVVNKINFFF